MQNIGDEFCVGDNIGESERERAPVGEREKASKVGERRERKRERERERERDAEFFQHISPAQFEFFQHVSAIVFFCPVAEPNVGNDTRNAHCYQSCAAFACFCKRTDTGWGRIKRGVML